MPIELRIQSGARAGVCEVFEKSVIAIGRHPMSDLRFDANTDLDVSARHGEIRALDGQYTIHDGHSTNGTFVNGARVSAGGSALLRDNDVIGFGADGPRVLVRIASATPTPSPPRTVPNIEVTAPPAAAPRQATSERVAVAVRAETRRLWIALVAIVVVLGGTAGGFLYVGARERSAREAKMQALVAANEEVHRELETRLQGDTALTNSLQRHNDSLTQAVREARDAAQAAAAALELRKNHDLQRQFADMGLPAVREMNDGAVALISTVIGPQPFEATGFSVSRSGVLVTNRHVVVDSTGLRASSIIVKFANTRNWRRAHLLKLPDDDRVDLALIQVDEGGPTFPSVRAVASTVDTPVGGSIATIGFPLGTDLPMDGSGNDGAASTSLTIGTVSKSVPGLLQIDAFASHGSSGSPVFDGHGHVIGVVWGGPADGAGRIVFAVPAEEVRSLLRGMK